MKKLINIFWKRGAKMRERKELERKAIEGAKRAVKEYKEVFDWLAEYDKT